jgi:N-methylhydantoinase B
VLQVRSDRRTHRPYGLHGGQPGKPSQNVMDPDGAHRLLDPKLTMTIRRGMVFRHCLPGSGGWGDPLERDPAKVLADVRNDFVSLAAAATEYGVVIDPASLTVDDAATARRRERMRARRGWTSPPAVVREVEPVFAEAAE